MYRPALTTSSWSLTGCPASCGDDAVALKDKIGKEMRQIDGEDQVVS